MNGISVTVCVICESPLAPRKRKLCGASDCKTEYQRRDSRNRLRAYKEANGRRFEDRYKRAVQCLDCSGVFYTRHPSVRCTRCSSARAASAAAAVHRARTATAREERGRRYLPVSRGSKDRTETKRWRDASARLLNTPRPANRRFANGQCEWCESVFTAVFYSGTIPRYCSAKCGRAKNKAERGRFLIPDAVRQAIYERDGWECQLCREPVDKFLPTSDRWAATLDHIVCQSWTDTPDHSPKNLRLAHRYCNSLRGDERYGRFAA